MPSMATGGDGVIDSALLAIISDWQRPIARGVTGAKKASKYFSFYIRLSNFKYVRQGGQNIIRYVQDLVKIMA